MERPSEDSIAAPQAFRPRCSQAAPCAPPACPLCRRPKALSLRSPWGAAGAVGQEEEEQQQQQDREGDSLCVPICPAMAATRGCLSCSNIGSPAWPWHIASYTMCCRQRTCCHTQSLFCAEVAAELCKEGSRCLTCHSRFGSAARFVMTSALQWQWHHTITDTSPWGTCCGGGGGGGGALQSHRRLFIPLHGQLHRSLALPTTTAVTERHQH